MKPYFLAAIKKTCAVPYGYGGLDLADIRELASPSRLAKLHKRGIWRTAMNKQARSALKRALRKEEW